MNIGLSQPVSDQPFWADGPGPLPELAARPPAAADVVVIGAGYTGLNAAIETARGGCSTLVLDAGDPGHGCSARNGGQISTSVKPSFAKLAGTHGTERARAIRAEGVRALEWIEERIRDERIECDFQRCGRFHAAHTPQHYESLCRDADILRADEGMDVRAVPRHEQLSELGSERYFGGVVFARHASLHPAKYLRGLLDSALKAGAQVVGHCAALDIERTAQGFVVATRHGPVRAREVIVATNGYTTSLTPWLRRRVIPIGSYIIATEELPAGLVDRLFPTNRIASDTCKVVYYFRASPDRRRVLFGGRVSAGETNPMISAPRLFEAMCRVFPELRAHAITHSWLGTVAYSFDELAHTGSHDGMHYAMGYCGSGVSMASYLGMRLGQKVLGNAAGRTAFDDLPFPTRPLYRGKPWFLPAAVAWYRWKDNWQYRKAMRMT